MISLHFFSNHLRILATAPLSASGDGGDDETPFVPKQPDTTRDPSRSVTSAPTRETTLQYRAISTFALGGYAKISSRFCGACASWLNGAKLWHRCQGRSFVVRTSD